MALFHEQFEIGAKNAARHATLNADAFSWLPPMTPVAAMARARRLNKVAARAALLDIPATPSEAFLCGWMSAMATQNADLLWAAVERGLPKRWAARVERSTPRTDERARMQDALDSILVAAVDDLAEADAVKAILLFGADPFATHDPEDGERPTWAQAILHSRLTEDTAVSKVMAQFAFGITQETALTLIDEVIGETLAVIADLDAEENNFWDMHPHLAELPDELDQALSSAQWEAFVDLDAMLQALADSQETMLQIFPQKAIVAPDMGAAGAKAPTDEPGASHKKTDALAPSLAKKPRR